MNKIDNIQLRVIEELEDDFIISIKRDDKEVELTYSCCLDLLRL